MEYGSGVKELPWSESERRDWVGRDGKQVVEKFYFNNRPIRFIEYCITVILLGLNRQHLIYPV
jgi:hypothetical protein